MISRNEITDIRDELSTAAAEESIASGRLLASTFGATTTAAQRQDHDAARKRLFQAIGACEWMLGQVAREKQCHENQSR